jgi:signal transduction histidine kinase
LPFTTRPYANRYFVFPITLPAHSEQTFYLRVQSSDGIIIPAKLWEPQAFHKHERNDYLAQALYFGMVTAMILFNLFLFIALHDVLYLLYVSFIISMAFAIGGQNGLTQEFLWSNATLWSNIAPFSANSFVAVTWILFMRRMLNTPTVIPMLDRLLKILIGVYLFSLVGFVVSVQTFAEFTVFLCLATTLLIFGIGAFCSFQRQRNAYFFVTATTMLCISIGIQGLTNLGVLPTNFFTVNAWQFGAALEMLLLAFALADRFNEIRKQKEKAQLEAFEAQRRLVENLKLAEQILEARVLERTTALEIAGEKLQLLVEKERENSVEKSNFLAMLTHELKSPLATIEMATGNIQRSQNPQITELSFKHIQSAAHDMSVITERCLQADKLEQGNSTLNLTEFSLDCLIQETFNGLADSTRVQLEISPPFLIASDDFLCRIIVSNLIENALKYSPAKSDVFISGTMDNDKNGVLISITNQIGKAGKPDAAKVFEKYYRNPNAQRERGTGLGLWLVQGIAAQLGGQVNYVEHHDKVEFQLWLPQ